MSNSLSYTLRLIAIALLLGCLAKMPYGYYQFVRIGTFTIFLVLAYQENERKRMPTMLMCIAFAILLNPILKVHFPRTIWNALDVGIAICLCVWTAIDAIKKGKSENGS